MAPRLDASPLLVRSCDLTFALRAQSGLRELCEPLVEAFPGDADIEFELRLWTKMGAPPAKKARWLAGQAVSPGDCASLRKISSRALEAQVRVVHPEVISAVLGTFLAWCLAQRGGLFIHAAGLVRDGRTFLLAGPSGAGKSTMTANSQGYTCLHDDRTAVRRLGEKWQAYGTPVLDNLGHPGRPERAVVDGIYFVEKAERDRQIPMSGHQALERLPQVLVLPEIAQSKTAVSSMLALADQVPFFRFEFRRSTGFHPHG